MTESPHTWYIQTDGGSTGPVPLEELKKRACRGSVVGTTLVSQTGEDPWVPASSVSSLELEWSVQPEDGEAFPPCHALALRGWVETGDIQPYWKIQHLPSNETYEVVDALCSALLAQNNMLEIRLEALGPVSEMSPHQEEVVVDAIDNLLRSLELKSGFLRDAQRKILSLQEERDRERSQREKETGQLEQSIDDLKTHLEEMDAAMSSLTRKYRELNDKYLRLRKENPSPSG